MEVDEDEGVKDTCTGQRYEDEEVVEDKSVRFIFDVHPALGKKKKRQPLTLTKAKKTGNRTHAAALT